MLRSPVLYLRFPVIYFGIRSYLDPYCADSFLYKYFTLPASTTSNIHHKSRKAVPRDEHTHIIHLKDGHVYLCC